MAKLQYEVEIDTSKMEEIITLAQGVAKQKTKEAVVEILNDEINKMGVIGQTSFMHFSAGDIISLLASASERVGKL